MRLALNPNLPEIVLFLESFAGEQSGYENNAHLSLSSGISPGFFMSCPGPLKDRFFTEKLSQSFNITRVFPEFFA